MSHCFLIERMVCEDIIPELLWKPVRLSHKGLNLLRHFSKLGTCTTTFLLCTSPVLRCGGAHSNDRCTNRKRVRACWEIGKMLRKKMRGYSAWSGLEGGSEGGGRSEALSRGSGHTEKPQSAAADAGNPHGGRRQPSRNWPKPHRTSLLIYHKGSVMD